MKEICMVLEEEKKKEKEKEKVTERDLYCHEQMEGSTAEEEKSDKAVKTMSSTDPPVSINLHV